MRFLKKLATFIGSLVIIILCILGFAFLISNISISKVQRVSGEKVGVVPIKGIITSSKKIIKNIDDFLDDRSIRAIVLRIDSPGGMVGPVQEIWEKVLEARRRKKVYASIASMGASGAYYIASAADVVIANPGSLVGSIGVIMEFPNLEGLMEKFGVKMEVVKSGRFKDTGSPFREMSQEEREYLKGVIEDVYKQFLSAVAKGRRVPVERIKPIADGRIMTGRMAKAYGLVDELGGVEKLKKRIEKDLGIKRVVFVYPPKRMVPLFERLIFGEREIVPPSGLYYLWRY